MGQDDFGIGIVGEMFVGEEGGGSAANTLKIAQDFLPVFPTIGGALSVILRSKVPRSSTVGHIWLWRRRRGMF